MTAILPPNDGPPDMFEVAPGYWNRRYTCSTGHAARVLTTRDGSTVIHVDGSAVCAWADWEKTCIDCRLRAKGEPTLNELLTQLADAMESRLDEAEGFEREMMVDTIREIREEQARKGRN